MIFEIIPQSQSPNNNYNNNIFMRPISHSVWDAYDMLDKAFPYNDTSIHGSFWQFFIANDTNKIDRLIEFGQY